MATGGAGPSGGRGERRRGHCKWFHVAKGFGFITPDDGSPDVFVHQSVIQMRGFRSLAEGEELEFESKVSGKGEEATFVCAVGGGDCLGSDRRPAPRKRVRKVRCYNCSEYGTHIAQRCPYGPMPKRCHICKAEEHLVADCPERPERDDSDSENGGGGAGDRGGGGGHFGGGGGDGGEGASGGGFGGFGAYHQASSRS